MEERRISKGVIRRRASKTAENEPVKAGSGVAGSSISAAEEASTSSVSEKAAVSASLENKVKSAAEASVAASETDIAAPVNEAKQTASIIGRIEIAEEPATEASGKKQKAGTENVKAAKVKAVKRGEKNQAAGAADILSVVKKLDIDSEEKVNGKDNSEESQSFKKPLKKEEFKKGQPSKFNKNEKFIYLNEDNEFFAHKRHKKKFKHNKGLQKNLQTVPIPEKKASKKVIRMANGITVSDLSQAMGVKASEVIKKLMDIGVITTINQTIDFDAASLISSEYGYTTENVGFDEAFALEEAPDTAESLRPRAPVVTVMGHVDHGKTSLLDAIRKTDVISNEAGGITQHIGAYSVSIDGSMITFLDTPGHEAFTEMRSRGASITDIVVLVVAADDGVMPQTVEAVNHAKAANVPIIVAINKIDKPGANPQKVKNSLLEFGLVPEELGGTTLFANVSAKAGTGIKELLELVLLQSEILELKANPDKSARGTVVEAKLDKGRGPVATVLIQNGTLKVNDSAVCGLYNVKVRAMVDHNGNKIDEAGPSTPVELFGLEGVPSPGDNFIVVKDEKEAKRISMERQLKHRESELSASSKMTLEGLYSRIKAGVALELKLIVKTDVFGSMEALIQSFKKLSTPKVKVNVIHSGASAITESDIMLAKATNSIIIAFNVRPEPKAALLSENEGIEIRYYNVIYDAVKDVKDAMEGLLKPIEKEKITGKAEVRDLFNVPKIGSIAGSFVLNGTIKRGSNARLLRDNIVIYTGRVDSLKRFKEDVREVQSNFECGILLENFNDVKVGDIIEAYDIEYIKQTLESSSEEDAQAIPEEQ